MKNDNTINIKGIQLFEHQLFVFNGLLSNNVDTIHTVVSPRQIGKSLLIQQILLYYTLNKSNTTSILISPTNLQNKKIFIEMKNMIEGNAPQILKSYNSTNYDLVFINGSSILFRSAMQRDNLRGYTVNGILCYDEATYIPDDIFYITMPFVNVHHAPILLCSTPKFKRGLFYQFYENGIKKEKGFYSYNLSQFDTSFLLSPEKKEMYKKQLPYNQYKSEYLGEFIDDDSVVFHNFSNCEIDDIQDYNILYCGIDWALGNNRTGNSDDTCVTFISDKNELISINYINNCSPIEQINKIKELINKYNPIKITVEENSIGGVYYDMLTSALPSHKIVKFLTTHKSKNNIIENLQIAFERKKLNIIKDEKLINELSFYESTYNSRTNSITYNSKINEHDDAVMSLAICWNSINGNIGHYNIKVL